MVSRPDCHRQFKQSNGPGTKVAGVGDDAFGYGVGLMVKVGDRCLDVWGLTVANWPTTTAPTRPMARIVIARLS